MQNEFYDALVLNQFQIPGVHPGKGTGERETDADAAGFPAGIGRILEKRGEYLVGVLGRNGRSVVPERHQHISAFRPYVYGQEGIRVLYRIDQKVVENLVQGGDVHLYIRILNRRGKVDAEVPVPEGVFIIENHGAHLFNHIHLLRVKRISFLFNPHVIKQFLHQFGQIDGIALHHGKIVPCLVVKRILLHHVAQRGLDEGERRLDLMHHVREKIHLLLESFLVLGLFPSFLFRLAPPPLPELDCPECRRNKRQKCGDKGQDTQRREPEWWLYPDFQRFMTFFPGR